MSNFVLKEVSGKNIESELKQIGFDSTYLFKAANKFRYKNIKIFNLSIAQANILKQTALIFGADCAVNREVVTGNIETSDAILCGSYRQLEKIATKLKAQPFKLSKLGDKIQDFISKKATRKTKIVGILNITPDSFSDGGLYFNPSDAQKHLLSLIEEGADIIDIGAESTKPYSTPVSAKEQIERLKLILEFITKEKISTPISIDTRSAEVADFVLNNGAQIINDVSGFNFDKNLPDIVKKYDATVIIQHSTKNSEDVITYQNVVEEVFLSLMRKIEFAQDKGIKNIIIDPGIGFGKSKKDNFELINNIEEFYSLNCPVMIGLSRKRLLGVENNDNSLKDSLSLALSYPLMLKEIDYLRVHNVKLHKTLLNSLPN